jgi:hypothetical protein
MIKDSDITTIWVDLSKFYFWVEAHFHQYLIDLDRQGKPVIIMNGGFVCAANVAARNLGIIIDHEYKQRDLIRTINPVKVIARGKNYSPGDVSRIELYRHEADELVKLIMPLEGHGCKVIHPYVDDVVVYVYGDFKKADGIAKQLEEICNQQHYPGYSGIGINPTYGRMACHSAKKGKHDKFTWDYLKSEVFNWTVDEGGSVRNILYIGIETTKNLNELDVHTIGQLYNILLHVNDLDIEQERLSNVLGLLSQRVITGVLGKYTISQKKELEKVL